MKLPEQLLFLLIIYLLSHSLSAQYEIKPAEGYTQQIGVMVDMLEEIKDRITEDVKDLSQEETDYLFDEQANSIGAMIMHLVATEVYCQAETLEERILTDEENAFWEMGSGLGEISREQIKG